MIKKIGLFIFFLSALLLILLLQYATEYIKNPLIPPLQAYKPLSQKPITISMVGDIMLDRGVARSVNNNFDGDFSKVFENVSELKQTDITFGNLEGPITTSTNKRGSIYSFKMEPSVAGVLSNAGFDIISFANNHVGDYGQEGFEDTLKYLNENNILAAGAGLNIEDTSLARIITVRGKKIGFLGFTDVGPDWMAATEKSPGVILASNPNMEKIISTEKEKVDYLVVSFHWGIEYKPVNDRQRELATKAVSAGADVVVGHHPHVIQDDIVINGKPVLFSLGNFVFDQTTPPQTKVGMVAVVTLNTDGTISLDRFSSERDSTFRPSSFRLFKDSDAVLEQKKEIVFSCPKPSSLYPNLLLTSFPRQNPIENYIPSDLVLIPKIYSVTKNICVTSKTYEAFSLMRKDMEKKGLLLLARYGFRDNDLQETLVASFTERGQSSFVAPVGQSEHILGTAFDFASGTFIGIFAGSPEYKFLKDNAYKYGFVQSFKGDPTDKTNIPDEPWHWRFVGSNLAKTIKSSGLPANLFLNSY